MESITNYTREDALKANEEKMKIEAEKSTITFKFSRQSSERQIANNSGRPFSLDQLPGYPHRGKTCNFQILAPKFRVTERR